MDLPRRLRRSRDETHFYLTITSDANAESGTGEVVGEISGPTKRHFATKNYGPGLLGIGVVLMCRNPELNFKRRIRLSKQKKMLYMDIMLDLERMRRGDHHFRKDMIVKRLAEEVPAVVGDYSIKDFDTERFLKDFGEWLRFM